MTTSGKILFIGPFNGIRMYPFLKEENRTCIEIPDRNIYVYGLSYEHREIHEALYDDWKNLTKEDFMF